MNQLSQIDLFIVVWLGVRALLDIILLGVKLWGT